MDLGELYVILLAYDSWVFFQKKSGFSDWEWVYLNSDPSIVPSSAMKGKNPPAADVEDPTSNLWKSMDFWILRLFPPAVCVPGRAASNLYKVEVAMKTVTTTNAAGKPISYQVRRIIKRCCLFFILAALKISRIPLCLYYRSSMSWSVILLGHLSSEIG